MSIDHNRIKIADLEKNQPNKTLITNENGELEFSDITGGSPNLQSVLDEGNEVQFESSYLNFLSGDVNERTFEVGINNGSPVGSGNEGSFLLLENDMLELQTDNDQKRGTIGIYFGDIELSQFNKTNNKKTSIQFNNPTATTSLRFPAKSEGTYTLATTDDLTSNSENFVHKTGEVSEIIDGQKRFTDTVIFRGQDTENWIEIDGKITFNETGGNAIHIKPVSGLEGEFFHTLPAKSGTYAMLDDLSTPVSATTMVKGVVKLAGDLGGTADLPTVPGLSGKENTITATTSADYFRGDKTFQPLNKVAVGLSSVDNTSDVNKPVSTATQTALNLKANITSPTFTGVPIVPTASSGTSTGQAASTQFVTNAINTDVNVQKLSDATINFAVMDSGASMAGWFNGDPYNRTLYFKCGNEFNDTYSDFNLENSRYLIQNVNTSYTSVIEIGEVGIQFYQKNTIGEQATVIGVDAAVSDTSINFPAISGGGEYKVQMQSKEYTVSALPTPIGSDSRFAIVTNALSPTYLSPVVGGGTVKVPVFHNGTTWVCH